MQTTLLATVCVAADYRIETDVFQDGVKEPIQQSLTLFADGVAYNWTRGNPQAVTVVDSGRRLIILLDADRRLRTQIELSHLSALIDAARKRPEAAAWNRDAAITETDADQRTISVGEKILRYQARFQATEDTTVCREYARFADAIAQYNSAFLKGIPPFARMSLNARVAEKGGLPEEIERILMPGPQQAVTRCRLHANWTLSEDDRQRIATLQEHLSTFELVDLVDFQAAANAAARVPAQTSR